ncbi:MAG: ribosome biogenesis GTPase Der [Verrucomicrobiota bacterium]
MSSSETELQETPEANPDKATPSRERTVAIVGRPNVGKSAIFNRLAGRRISIVHDQPGVTRDRIAAPCRMGKAPFTVIDTGGIGAALDDGFAGAVHAEVDIAIETADLIVFTVDGQDGLSPIDLELATLLRKADRPVILAVNKIDEEKHDALSGEFAKLGFERSLSVSAEHNRGFERLVAEIEFQLPEATGAGDIEEDIGSKPIHIAIVGRPNVGKSSMINALLGDERTIVSDVAGTTRDAVDVPFERGGQEYILIDTAGLRQRNKRDSTIEVFSAMRTERTIRRADICALVIDAAAGVTRQDMRIAQAVVEEGKPCVIVANKFDLYHPDAKRHDRLEILREDVGNGLFFLHYAPIVAASALHNENVDRLFREVEQVKHASRQEIGTGEFNRILHELFTINPPPSIKTRKYRRLKLLYATMARKDDMRPIPVPEFVMFVNDATLLPDSYARYLENKLREKLPMTGLPLQFKVKGREKK